MTAENGDKTATFDKATNTITIKKDYDDQTGLDIWLFQDISDFNIIRVKYRVDGVDGIGFHLFIDYENDNLDDYENPWFGRLTYCPSYLTEMVIPLKNGMQQINKIGFFCPNYVKDEKFVIQSVTLEQISNPQKTDVWAAAVQPVIDNETTGNIDDTISAWDYVKNLSTGLAYCPFFYYITNLEQDYGMDIQYGEERPTKEIIQFIKAKGFKTIRLQTRPDVHMVDENYTIAPQYIEAIKKVVDWAIEENMYVIICGPFSDNMQREDYRQLAKDNVHYTGYLLNENDKNESAKLLTAIWKQYAQAFNNSYDEHLIFETLNEPIDALHEHAWFPETNCPVCIEDFAILNEHNQLIVDTIRSTGGNNAKRFIMVEGLAAARWQFISTDLFELPKDNITDRLIPSVHLYPLAGERSMYTSGIKKQQITDCFDALDTTYFSKHIPVYFSEIGDARNIPILERINSLKDLMAEVTNGNRSCSVNLYSTRNTSEEGGFVYNNYTTFEWYDTELIETLLQAAQDKNFQLSDDFIKTNEVKVESIVGKNLLSEPVEFKINEWSGYKINPDVFVRSTPAKYKIEIQIEKTGTAPEMCFMYKDWNYNEHSVIKNATGGTINGQNISIESDTVTIYIDEETAETITGAMYVSIGGHDFIIKSMKVVE